MITFIGAVVCFSVAAFAIGYLWGEARGIFATEKRWSEAVRRAAWPRRALNRELPPGERISGDWDQPNGKCSSCGAPLNSSCVYRFPSRPISFVTEPNREWLR